MHPAHCPNRFLNHGQSVPRIKGCVRHDLTTAFPLRFLSLYLISGSTVGYLCMSPCMYLTSTHSTFSNAPGQTRVWWTKVCVHPESTIAWCIPLTTLPLCVPRGLREGVRGPATRNTCPPLCQKTVMMLVSTHTSNIPAWWSGEASSLGQASRLADCAARWFLACDTVMAKDHSAVPVGSPLTNCSRIIRSSS